MEENTLVYLICALYIGIILLAVYLMTRKEERQTKIGVRGYFAVVTALFLISVVLFTLFDVGGGNPRFILIFSYLFVIPLLMLIGYKILGYIKGYSQAQRLALGFAGLLNLLVFGYILLFIFTWLFYYMI